MGYYGILRRIIKKVNKNIELLCLKSDSSQRFAQKSSKNNTENRKKYLTIGPPYGILTMLPLQRQGYRGKKTLILHKKTLDILLGVCYSVYIMREEVESMV